MRYRSTASRLPDIFRLTALFGVCALLGAASTIPTPQTLAQGTPAPEENHSEANGGGGIFPALAAPITRFFSITVAGQRAGGIAFLVESLEGGGRKESERTIVKMTRGATTSIIERKGTKVYDRDGTIVEETLEKSDNGIRSTYAAKREGDKLAIHDAAPEHKGKREVAVPKIWGSRYTALAQLLSRARAEAKPTDLAAPERRSISYMVYNLERGRFDNESLALVGAVEAHGDEKDKRINVVLTMPEAGVEAQFDADFVPIHMIAGPLAIEEINDDPFDLNAMFCVLKSEIEVHQVIPDWRMLEAAKVRLTVKNDEGPDVFSACDYHDLVALSRSGQRGATYELALKALKPPKNFTPAALPMNDLSEDIKRFLRPTSMCQSDDTDVVLRAKELAGTETNSLTVVDRIVQWVHDAVKGPAGAQIAASAVETLTSRRGDCTEHAALVVALCRAAGIPARNVSGMEYLVVTKNEGEKIGSIGFHAWAEVWVGHWVGVDSTIPEVGTGARYCFFGYNEPGLDEPARKLLRCYGTMEAEVRAYRLSGADWVNLENR